MFNSKNQVEIEVLPARKSIREIVRETGLSPNTVRRFAASMTSGKAHVVTKPVS